MNAGASLRDDYGRLVLRLAVGGLLLFHGVAKLTGGLGFVRSMLEQNGLPTMMAYGSYLGEVVAPILIMAGVLTRPAAVVVMFNMAMAILLALRGRIFSMNPGGAWGIEVEMFFLLGALAVALLGAGRLSLRQGAGKWD